MPWNNMRGFVAERRDAPSFVLHYLYFRKWLTRIGYVITEK